MNDLRFAIRQLLKNPGFTAVSLLTLSLCIGLNSAIFSAVHALIFYSLPYPEPDRLVRVFHTSAHSDQWPHSPADFHDYRQQTSAFEELAAFRWSDVTLSGNSDLPERVTALRTTANFFPTLGVTPALGRVFLPEEEEPGHDKVIVLSHGLWLRRFAGDTNIVGQTLRVNSEPVQVVGVMPAHFDSPRLWDQSIQAWRPLTFTDREKLKRSTHYLNVVGRLKAGVSARTAETELKTIADRLARQYPEANSQESARLVPFRQSFGGEVEAPIYYFLLATAGFVLLIGCVNVASLNLARFSSRRREWAIRAALGASGARLLCPWLLESLCVGALGGGMGLVMAYWVNQGLLAIINPPVVSQGTAPLTFPINLPVLGYALGLVLFTVVVIGFLVVRNAGAPLLHRALREGESGTASAHRSSLRLRGWLVIVQLAMTLALLTGCGLFSRAIAQYLRMDPGFQTDRLLAFQIRVPSAKYTDKPQRTNFFRRTVERLEALPGVERVGAGTDLPVWEPDSSRYFRIEGRPEPEPGRLPIAHSAAVTPDYFSTLGIPLIRGRQFTDRDEIASPRVVVINETMAKTFWPGEDAVGKRILFGTLDSGDWREIVGVVQDVRHPGSYEWKKVRPEFFEPMWQDPWNSTWVILRTSRQTDAFAHTLRRAIADLDSDVAAYRLTTVRQALSSQFIPFQVIAWLLLGFSVLGLVLAAVGLYGVVSYTATQRTREIGIRVALGAQERDVLKMVLQRALHLIGIGLALGLAGAAALAHAMRGILFGLHPTDPGTFAVAIMVLSGIALLACYVPARRAARLDPMVALRRE